MVPEQVWDWQFCSYQCVFFVPLVWFFLWLPVEVLTLLFLLHHENGDFSTLMKDNSSGCKVHMMTQEVGVQVYQDLTSNVRSSYMGNGHTAVMGSLPVHIHLSNWKLCPIMKWSDIGTNKLLLSYTCFPHFGFVVHVQRAYSRYDHGSISFGCDKIAGSQEAVRFPNLINFSY
jgi:hypothetical protein